MIDRVDEDLAVADLPRLGGRGDRLDRPVHEVCGHRDLDLQRDIIYVRRFGIIQGYAEALFNSVKAWKALAGHSVPIMHSLPPPNVNQVLDEPFEFDIVVASYTPGLEFMATWYYNR